MDAYEALDILDNSVMREGGGQALRVLQRVVEAAGAVVTPTSLEYAQLIKRMDDLRKALSGEP